MKNILNFLSTTLQNDFEIIFQKKHIVFNIYTNPEFKINNWEYWKEIYPHIDALLKLQYKQEDAFIRTFQAFELENKWLGFGRMKWNFENNKKWIQKYQSKDFSDKKLIFFNTEIWSPDWNYYTKTGQTPKIFVNIYSDVKSSGYIFALNKRFYTKNKIKVENILEEIKNLTPKSKIRNAERWWKPMFKNEISNMNLHDLIELFVKE